MKKLLIIFLAEISFCMAYSQRIVEHAIIPDLDGYYNTIDTNLARNHFKSIKSYRCKNGVADSCVLLRQETYDSNGRLIHYAQGSSAQSIDYFEVSQRSLNDSMVEVVARYPPTSTAIPIYFYIDTTINGDPQHICLYATDKENRIVVRSNYLLDNSDYFKRVDRYDLNNKLTQVYYPIGSEEPISSSTTVNKHGSDSTVIVVDKYKKSQVISTYVYNNLRQIKEHISQSEYYSPGSKSSTITVYTYNSDHLLIDKSIFEDGELSSQEKWSYKGKILAKHTRDSRHADKFVRVEESEYDDKGNLVIDINYSESNKLTFVWRSYYSSNGLRERMEFYVNGQLENSDVYKYE